MASRRRETSPISGKLAEVADSPTGDARIVALADRQHGVVGRPQLLGLGFSADQIDHRVRQGWLVRVHRGAFAVGRARVGRDGRGMAAVLACGPATLVSHRSAVGAWGVGEAGGPAVEVTVPPNGGRGMPGIVVHRSGTLTPADRAMVRGVPCTSVARTIVDVADVLRSRRALERLIEEADRQRRFDLVAVDDALRRASTSRGSGVLRRLLAELAGSEAPSPTTRRGLEVRFLELCRSADLPLPQVNSPVLLRDGTPIVVDFLWPREGLAVETDGWETHGTRQAFVRDRRRDAELVRLGLRTVRLTWQQVVHDPADTVAMLRDLLGLPDDRAHSQVSRYLGEKPAPGTANSPR